MRQVSIVLALLALAACGEKKTETPAAAPAAGQDTSIANLPGMSSDSMAMHGDSTMARDTAKKQ